MKDAVLEVIGGGESFADDVSWVPPARAVQPQNHFHTLYMRLTEINDGLLVAARDPDVAQNDAFVELLGACGSISNQMAAMTQKLESIRRDFPRVWSAWQFAVRYQPLEESGG